MADNLSQIMGYENPLSENYWNKIVSNSSPSEIFRLDWSNYTTSDFAQTFLSNVRAINKSPLWIFDGAELFINSAWPDNQIFLLDSFKSPIRLSTYTYPKGVMAEERKERVRVNDDELATFMEITQDNSLVISFKFGYKFRTFLNGYFKDTGSTVTANSLENKVYLTDASDLTDYFKNKLGHYDVLSYILETIGVEIISYDQNEDVLNDIVMFFRSVEQSEGFPKENPNEVVTTTTGKKVKGVLDDNGYDRSFGFDLYRPDQYGTNSKIYITEHGITRDSGKTIEDTYRSDSHLSLSLRNSKSKDYYISQQYTLEKGGNPSNNVYRAPNVMVPPGQTVKIFAKHFSPDNKELTVSIIFSHKNGIQKHTESITFSRGKNLQPVEIITKPNEVINMPIEVTVNKATATGPKVIGGFTLFPNELLSANYLFVNVTYKVPNDNTPSKPTDVISIVKTLNSKTFNQASICINNCNREPISLEVTPESGSEDESGNIQEKLSSFITFTNQQYIAKDVDSVKRIVEFLFNKRNVLEILDRIEQKFKSIQVKGSDNTSHPILKEGETIKALLESINQKDYPKFIFRLITFITYIDINLYAAYMATNIRSTGNPFAVGTTNGSGLIIPVLDSPDQIDTVAHEIGHNLNLFHTFLEPNKNYDLTLDMTRTRENIMDYVVDRNRKTFITFQWDRMRNVLKGKPNGLQLEITNGNRFQIIKGEDPRSSYFSEILFQSASEFHSQFGYNLNLEIDDQNKILTAMIDSIKEQINKLCII